MATAQVRPGRTLVILAVILAGLLAWLFWPGVSHSPKLGLDLRGGTQVILTPSLASGQGGTITQDALNQTVSIIQQRVNGLGVSEATVQLQGNGNNAAIVVSVPGLDQSSIANTLKETALLDFRPVVQEAASGATSTPTPTASASKSPAASKSASPTASASASPSPTPSASASASPSASPTSSGTSPKVPVMSSANDATLQAAYASVNCADPANRPGGIPDDPNKWIVTCSTDGLYKYLLEPAFIKGTNVSNAQAALPQSGAGAWVVNLTFDDAGSKALATVSANLVNKPSPTNQFAIVLDGTVFSSPYFQSAILGGQAEISGNFTIDQAKSMANVLKYGALPLTLNIGEVTSVSPTIGSDQLNAGLIAGAIGLALVVLYLLFYYRALGLVSIASLLVAAAVSYALFVGLGRTIGFTFTLAGVAGAIVAIGITADSFVVYFERIRDEIRDGKSLRTAVDTAWVRARRTILAADFVSFLAAVVLYYLSIGSVRGFAFTLGLTTLVDVGVAFLFTRPLVVYVARSRWFSSGANFTGLSPARLGVVSLTAPRAGRTAAKEI